MQKQNEEKTNKETKMTNARYLDPRADLTFKKVFGEHPHLVMSLLNAMLPLKDDECVESITYWPAEMIPERTEAEKYSIVDVCCKDNNGREFIVEMQMSWTEAFKKRVLLNASKAYVAQSKRGGDYSKLQPVYALNFVNEVMQPDIDDYYHYYHLVHDKFTNKVIDGLHLIFIELPKFKPQTFSEKKMHILWLRYLTEINESTREVPSEFLENAEVKEALEIVKVAAFSDEEMRAYDKFWDNVSVQITLENAYKQKMEQADEQLAKAEAEMTKADEQLAKAEAEMAKAEAKTEQAKAVLQKTVHNLKSMNLTTQQISEATGLSAEEIEAL